MTKPQDSDPASDSLSAQLEIWQAWLKANSAAAGGDVAMSDSPLVRILESWRQKTAELPSVGSNSALERAIQAATEFMLMGQALIVSRAGAQGADGDAPGLTERLHAALLQSGLATHGTRGGTNLLSALLTSIPGELQTALGKVHESVAQGMPTSTGKTLLSELMSALGDPSRVAGASWERDIRVICARWADFQAAHERYANLLSEAASDATARMEAALAEDPTEYPPQRSLRLMYDLWIECNEDAYGELLAGEVFPEAYAETINALARLKAETGNLGQRLLSWIDAPSKEDLLVVQKRLHDERRRSCELESRFRAADHQRENLEHRIAALESLLDEARTLSAHRDAGNSDSRN